MGVVNLVAAVRHIVFGKAEPEHLRRGRIGERAAKRYLEKLGLKFLIANFRSPRGEIDLVFRDRAHRGIGRIFREPTEDCLVFVEVKSRSSEEWGRPAAAAIPYFAVILNFGIRVSTLRPSESIPM